MYFTTDSAGKPGLPFYKTLLCLLCVLILVVNGISLARNLQSLRSANDLQSQGARVSDLMPPEMSMDVLRVIDLARRDSPPPI